MSSWHENLKRLFQVLYRPLVRLLTKLQGLKEPEKQLHKICEILQQQLANPQKRDKAWQNYTKALLIAKKCDPAKLSQLILRFDSQFDQHSPISTPIVGQSLSFLLEAKPQVSQYLDAAWRLVQRLPEPSKREVQQEICLHLARMGESNLLLVRLLEQHREYALTATEISQILTAFLQNYSFQEVDPWKAFLEQFNSDELPRIHQVYSILERYDEASKLAEVAKDYRSAIHYLMPLCGQDVALRTLALAHQLGEENIIAQAHQKVAENYWQADNTVDALKHFQKAGNLERVSDCHQKLGELGLAIQCRPTMSPEWRQEIQEILESTVRSQIEQREFLAAVRLLKSVEVAWRETSQTSEAERTQHLLLQAVRTVRSAFTLELQTCEGHSAIDLHKRWSLLEETAENYLEAGLQAEKAQDYFAASVLFEKASAFGQALVALETAAAEGADPWKKAELLEQGGDFFMAALLYERLGSMDLAIALYEQSGEFLRAAELRDRQLGSEQVLFDARFQDLLVKAGRIEQLAERCVAKATEPGQSTDQKARLWRQVKDLAEQGFLGQKWLDRVAVELPGLELLNRRQFEQQAAAWVQSASRQVLAEYTDVIGVDLGTSNSVVCLYNKRQGTPEVVEQHRRRQIPSVFAIDQAGRELVGVSISELVNKSPRAIITKAKREMGTDRKFRAGGQDYRAEEISARIINYARQFAREYLQQKVAAKVSTIAAQTTGSTPPIDWINEFLAQHPPSLPLSNIVITVPAYFNEAQKQATKTAGVLADIRVLRLIHEPTAACLAQRIQDNKAETILVADLGAGTFDLSSIQTGDGVFEVQEIEGDNALGGADLDELLYTHFSDFIKAETGQEIPRNSQAATRLRQACEELKIELSSHREWVVDLPYLIGDRTIQLILTQQELEQLATPWLKRIRLACQKIRHKPNRILLIGGGGLMPAVRRCIGEVFNREVDSAYDPLTVVARGAALQGAILMGDVQKTLLLDVIPFSLGIKCRVAPGEFKFDSVIPKHTTIPTDKTQRYTTTEDGQTQVRIEIFQGESPVPEENFKIGEFILQGIPIAKAGVPQIDVKFEIDANCLLIVTARDASTGNQQSITIADSHLLTPAQTTSLQSRFRNSQLYQESLVRLEKLTVALKAALHEVEQTDLAGLLVRFQKQIQAYEQYRERYLPTSLDNNILFEIYRDRTLLEDRARLILDQWSSLSRSIRFWLDQRGSLDWRSTEISNQVRQLLEEGDRLLQRTYNTQSDINDVAANYQTWLSILENLPINPEGNPETLAHHFLRLQRYSEALTQFQRLTKPLAANQVELGLEILARARQRESYTALLLEHIETLDFHSPDFERLNHTVRIYASSVVWLQIHLGDRVVSGSGFVISPSHIATNRHVLVDEMTRNCVAPEAVQVITQDSALQVVAIHLPTWGTDDVAILQIQPVTTSLTPLRLGFSELVEVGERIMTIGFPAPESGGFAENLYCNTGLVNRIRLSQLCTERVLEVSIPLQGGISGAPILNQFGEVIGLLTFWTERRQELFGEQLRSERSFYAIPVELLRRLHAEFEN